MTNDETFTLINRLADGTFGEPDGDALAAVITMVQQTEARACNVIGVAVALAKRNYIGNLWIGWAHERFGLAGSYLHHLRAVGDLLLDVLALGKGDTATYRLLFSLAFNKLVPLTSINVVQIDAFLKQLKKPITEMNRLEVRLAVRIFLGESVKETDTAIQQLLPGFDNAVGSIAQMDAESVVGAVTERNAENAFRSGFILVGAALEYQKTRREVDVVALQQAKSALLEEVAEIESVIASALEQSSSASAPARVRGENKVLQCNTHNVAMQHSKKAKKK